MSKPRKILLGAVAGACLVCGPVGVAHAAPVADGHDAPNTIATVAPTRDAHPSHRAMVRDVINGDPNNSAPARPGLPSLLPTPGGHASLPFPLPTLPHPSWLPTLPPIRPVPSPDVHVGSDAVTVSVNESVFVRVLVNDKPSPNARWGLNPVRLVGPHGVPTPVVVTRAGIFQATPAGQILFIPNAAHVGQDVSVKYRAVDTHRKMGEGTLTVHIVSANPNPSPTPTDSPTTPASPTPAPTTTPGTPTASPTSTDSPSAPDSPSSSPASSVTTPSVNPTPDKPSSAATPTVNPTTVKEVKDTVEGAAGGKGDVTGDGATSGSHNHSGATSLPKTGI